ncbi:small glutamine-rich tetratricopeptide repeat-containing protein-like protein [Lophiostoma macrostomum CBS 122681]|uniref:Small glutamine-rich tetratricopeptide repeat-containing protein-like protein n=1 Tax=Lophiostoma macrostomum CBS 122681 TaxID=1314788 RepID=A0A6A6SZ71_9PLEO|nr:small glutamine-rich tetratricopeptide repeat-containing protein-like protein [Lophiostoma macrostomum CBS 122681]
MASSPQSKKRLALAILDFLQTSQTDGSVASEDAEQLEVASTCIAEAFKVDPTDTTAVSDALGGQNLLSIYNVYEKLKGKSTASTAGPSSANEARPATPQTPAETSKGSKSAEAEKLKGLGNEAMKKKEYDTAIEYYTKALDVVPLNPIYLSNRAAAYSGCGQHEEAQNDAELAVAADPKYSKAWSRLGLAKFALGDAKGAMEAYKSGMDAEEGGGSEVMRKGYETAKRKYEDEGGDVGAPEADRGAPGAGGGGMPDLSSLAGMLGGGGGGGGGGMPDLSSLMQNPMMRQMAQNVMQNPEMLSGLMNNPQLQSMLGGGGGRGAGAGAGRGGGGGGGMPDLSQMMNDPNIAEM